MQKLILTAAVDMAATVQTDRVTERSKVIYVSKHVREAS
jgi:hypothetical protein